jgi:protein-disulfide isomerase
MDLAIPVNPARDHVRGNPDGIDIVMYGDFECPYGAQTAPVLQALLARIGDLIMVCYRHFPLIEIHPHSVRAAEAAEAAAAQDAFWPMHDLLFSRQDRLTDADLRRYGTELGLDGDPLVGAAAQRFGDKVEADFAGGVALGVPGTPTLFIDGVRFEGRPEIGALRRAVARSAAGSDADAGLQPGAGRQHPRGVRFRRAQREPFAEDA